MSKRIETLHNTTSSKVYKILAWNNVILGKYNACYICLRRAGHKKKRDAIYTMLLEEGVKQEALERVHSPIGLSIGAETPEEIAISIVAELINERARQKE